MKGWLNCSEASEHFCKPAKSAPTTYTTAMIDPRYAVAIILVLCLILIVIVYVLGVQVGKAAKCSNVSAIGV
jgi:hypothetical protein